MFNYINDHIKNFSTISDDDLLMFNSILEFKHFPKKSIIFKAGEVSNYMAFIIKGIGKAYVYDQQKNEFVIYFPKEEWWITDLKSFYNREPASIQFEAIEDCDIICIPHDKLINLLGKKLIFESAAHNIMNHYTILCQERLIDMITLSAKERYEKFALRFPDIIQRVPQKSIASYIGVTPEFLSKIRSMK